MTRDRNKALIRFCNRTTSCTTMVCAGLWTPQFHDAYPRRTRLDAASGAALREMARRLDHRDARAPAVHIQDCAVHERRLFTRQEDGTLGDGGGGAGRPAGVPRIIRAAG